jgi:hypothetical protein
MSDQPDIPRKLRAKFEKVTSDLAIERQKLEAAKKRVDAEPDNARFQYLLSCADCRVLKAESALRVIKPEIAELNRKRGRASRARRGIYRKTPGVLRGRGLSEILPFIRQTGYPERQGQCRRRR